MHNNWIPPSSATTAISEGHPRPPPPGSTIVATITQPANANAAAITISPSCVANRNGRSEKLVMPSNARWSILRNVYLVSPAKRGSRSYSTAHCRESGPHDHAAHVAVALRHAREHVDHHAVEQAEVAGLPRERHLGHPVDESVIDLAREQLEPGLPRSVHPHAVDDLEALLPFLDHLRDHLGRILEVGVDDHHEVAARVIDSCAQCDLMTEVPRQVDDPNVVVIASDGLQQLQ